MHIIAGNQHNQFGKNKKRASYVNLWKGSKERNQASKNQLGEKPLHSPVSPMSANYMEEGAPCLDSSLVRPDLEMTGSSPNPAGVKPELSGISMANQTAELSPYAEWSTINSPNRTSGHTWSTENAAWADQAPLRSDPLSMRSNLNLSPPQADRSHSRRNSTNRHVLSWMKYEDSSDENVI